MSTEFKTWEELSELEQLECIYCDMHKDVYGVKARWYRADSVEQARKDLARLEAALVAQMEEDARFQQEAITAFEQLVSSVCGDRETAIRWQLQAYDTQDVEHLEYRLGLPFGYLTKTV